MSGMRHGTYLGSDQRLLNLTALLREGTDDGEVLAQFDRISLPEAYGWHEFDVADFVFDEPEPLSMYS